MKKQSEMDASCWRKGKTLDASNAEVSSVSEDGAGGGTRTHTESPPADFESATSTIPSHRRIMIFDQDLHLLFHRANTATGYYTPSPGKKQGIFSCRQGGTGINAKN